MQTIFGISSNYWSIGGLVADILGVGLLTYDLIKVQRQLRNQSYDNLTAFEDIANSHGGVGEWIQKIRKNARWVRSEEYEDWLIQDEASFNTEQCVEGIKDVSKCLNNLAANLGEIIALLNNQMKSNHEAATNSLIYSHFGIILIIVGFIGQVMGNYPMPTP
ncbi:MAG TPA: hypothetical protein VFR09_08415 [Alphaproteobacteria bacterium]|nr:hypothetical protein [Alphaproteobacteria bacterium]